MITRQHIVDVARTWVGTPYRHQGRQKGVAIDCVGLIWGISVDLGQPTPTIAKNYTTSPSGGQLIQGCDKYLVPAEKLFTFGSIAVFFGPDRNEAQHFAIIGQATGRLTMIHAFSKLGKVVEHAVDRFWGPRLMAVYEYPDTEPLGAVQVPAPQV